MGYIYRQCECCTREKAVHHIKPINQITQHAFKQVDVTQPLTAYLIGRGYKLKNVEKSFNDALNMSRQQSRIEKTKSTNSKNKIVFCSKYNPLGPSIKRIIQKHAPILDNCQIMENKQIMVAYKREKNLKELLTSADPYNTDR